MIFLSSKYNYKVLFKHKYNFSANTNTICYADLNTILYNYHNTYTEYMQMYTQILTQNCTQYALKIVGKCTHKIVFEKNYKY